MDVAVAELLCVELFAANAVMKTPAMLTITETTFIKFRDSSFRKMPIQSVNNDDVENNIVALATLVL